MWSLLDRGSTMIALGAIMVFWTTSVSSQLQQPFAETAPSFKTWRERDTPVYMEFYMFNVTNVDDILSGKNVSIRVEQLGPYVYREIEAKTNISWHENSTVEFYNLRYWHFEPDMSNGSLTDEIVSVNPVILTLANQVQHFTTFLRMSFDAILSTLHENMFLRADVSSWLFDGIHDSLFDLTAQLPNVPYGFNKLYDKFGWFYRRNGSIERGGPFLMNTGAADISKLGNLEKWNFSERTVYRGECGEVKGSTAGELLASEIGQNITIFEPDICTYMVLPKDKDIIVDGVEGVQYAADKTVFDNGHTVPEMACYCDEVRNQNCLPSGALNVSACRFEAPVFVSLPHFLHSDAHYLNKIEGLNPTEDMNFRVTLEKSTGKPISIVEQLQINLLVRHVYGIRITEAFPNDLLVPMFWYKREVRLGNTSKLEVDAAVGLT